MATSLHNHINRLNSINNFILLYNLSAPVKYLIFYAFKHKQSLKKKNTKKTHFSFKGKAQIPRMFTQDKLDVTDLSVLLSRLRI